MSGRLGRSSQAIAREPTPNATMSAAKIATGTYPDTRLLLWWENRSGSRVYSTRGRTGNRRLIPGTHVRRRGADRAQKSGLRRGMRVALSWGMSPGGHLVTTAIACAGTAALTGSWPATAAVAAGGFLI